MSCDLTKIWRRTSPFDHSGTSLKKRGFQKDWFRPKAMMMVSTAGMYTGFRLRLACLDISSWIRRHFGQPDTVGI